jgi:hypothetical protein
MRCEQQQQQRLRWSVADSTAADSRLCDWDSLREQLAAAASAHPTPPPFTAAHAIPPRNAPGLSSSYSSSSASPPPVVGVADDVAPIEESPAEGRPPATVGDVVLVEAEGRRTVGLVVAFDGARYMLATPSTGPRGDGAESDGDAWAGPALILAASRSDTTTGACGFDGRPICARPSLAVDRWDNAPPSECVVCADAEADAVLGCRCTVPCMCAGCASTGAIGRCPQCGSTLRVWRYRDADGPNDAHHHTASVVMARLACRLVPTSATSAWMQVSVRLTRRGGSTLVHPIRVQGDWPAALVKALLHPLVGRPPSGACVALGGRPLEDDAPLDAQGVIDGCVIDLALRARDT